MGGDESVKQGLLNHRGHHFGTIESIVITSAVPRSRDGKVVDGFITVIVKVTGNEIPDRKIIEKNVTLQVYLKDGQWKVL